MRGAQRRASRPRRGHGRARLSDGRRRRAAARPRAPARRRGDLLRAGRAAGRRGGRRDTRRGAHARRPRPPAPARPRPRGRRGRDARAAGRAHARCCPSCDAPGTLRHGPVTLCARSVAACNLRRAHPHPCRSAAACGHPAPPSSRARHGPLAAVDLADGRALLAELRGSVWVAVRRGDAALEPPAQGGAPELVAPRHRPRAAAGSARSSRSRRALGAAAVALATGLSGSRAPAVAGPTARRRPPLARSSRSAAAVPARARGGRAVALPVARAVPPPVPRRHRLRRHRLRRCSARTAAASILRRRPCPSSRRHPRCDGRVPDWKR